MIRVVLLLILGVAFFILYRANIQTAVTIQWLDHTTLPIPIPWLLLYTFLAGALGYALFTFPERFKTWKMLRKNKKSLRKMGKSLTNVINSSHPPKE